MRPVSFLTQKVPHQLRQHEDGTTIVYQRLFGLILDGKVFSASHRFESVASDDSVSMYFENPQNSGKDAYIVAIEIVSTGKFWIDIYRGNTVTTHGTSVTPANLNLSSSNTPACKVEYGGTYTAGTLAHQSVAPGGSHLRAIGSIVEVGESVVISPGDNLLIVATNKSASSEDMSIRIIWWEE